MKTILFLSLLTTATAWAHVPALLLPITGTPISSYFIGQSDISRAVYSEITDVDDFFVVQINVNRGNESILFQLFTPACDSIPEYERFQPIALLLRGEIPWKTQGESNSDYLKRLKKKALVSVQSSFPEGKRPKFYEAFAKQYFWIGGEWRGKLRAGLFSIIVFDESGKTGNFTVGLNEKEAWSPDLFKYVGEVLPRISAGICSRTGYTGKLELKY